MSIFDNDAKLANAVQYLYGHWKVISARKAALLFGVNRGTFHAGKPVITIPGLMVVKTSFSQPHRKLQFSGMLRTGEHRHSMYGKHNYAWICPFSYFAE
jgi:hypothetical protein